MSSIQGTEKGLRICFNRVGRKRASLRMAKHTQEECEVVVKHVDALILAEASVSDVPVATRDWLHGVSDKFRARLRDAGLLGYQDALISKMVKESSLDSDFLTMEDLTKQMQCGEDHVRQLVAGGDFPKPVSLCGLPRWSRRGWIEWQVRSSLPLMSSQQSPTVPSFRHSLDEVVLAGGVVVFGAEALQSGVAK